MSGKVESADFFPNGNPSCCLFSEEIFSVSNTSYLAHTQAAANLIFKVVRPRSNMPSIRLQYPHAWGSPPACAKRPVRRRGPPHFLQLWLARELPISHSLRRPSGDKSSQLPVGRERCQKTTASWAAKAVDTAL